MEPKGIHNGKIQFHNVHLAINHTNISSDTTCTCMLYNKLREPEKGHVNMCYWGVSHADCCIKQTSSSNSIINSMNALTIWTLLGKFQVFTKYVTKDVTSREFIWWLTKCIKSWSVKLIQCDRNLQCMLNGCYHHAKLKAPAPVIHLENLTFTFLL